MKKVLAISLFVSLSILPCKLFAEDESYEVVSSGACEDAIVKLVNRVSKYYVDSFAPDMTEQKIKTLKKNYQVNMKVLKASVASNCTETNGDPVGSLSGILR